MIETCGFTRKNEDGREAGRRLANHRLQPLGHLTAHPQVYVTQDTYTGTIGSDLMKATRDQTVAFDAKCNDKRALYLRRATRFGHSLGTLLGTHAVFFARSVQKTEGKRDKATVSLTVASNKKREDVAYKHVERHKADVVHEPLDLMILKTLEAIGPLHGYSIARRIKQTSDDPLSINQGTIGPAASRRSPSLTTLWRSKMLRVMSQIR